jgi:hypothetical protein
MNDSKNARMIPIIGNGDRKIARAIAIYSATDLLTTNAKIFSAKRPSKEDVVSVAKYFAEFIEET